MHIGFNISYIWLDAEQSFDSVLTFLKHFFSSPTRFSVRLC